MKNRSAFFLSLLACSLLLAGCNQAGKSTSTPKFTTDYQAVYMDNGQVFFGKLEHMETEYPVLREVFYVQNQVNPDTKEVKNILVKRGQEWHAPDQMYLNAHHILAIEPVAPASQLARLIQQAGSGGTPTK